MLSENKTRFTLCGDLGEVGVTGMELVDVDVDKVVVVSRFKGVFVACGELFTMLDRW